MRKRQEERKRSLTLQQCLRRELRRKSRRPLRDKRRYVRMYPLHPTPTRKPTFPSQTQFLSQIMV